MERENEKKNIEVTPKKEYFRPECKTFKPLDHVGYTYYTTYYYYYY